MENFLGDLLPALKSCGVETSALVHNDFKVNANNLTGYEKVCKIKKVPCMGEILYVPISPGFIWSMRKTVKEFAPDILHFHMPNFSAFWALFLRCAMKLPWVIQWHSDVVFSKEERKHVMAYSAYQPFERAMLSKADVIITSSKRYLDTSNVLKKVRDKSLSIPLGIDPGRLKTDARSMEECKDLWGENKRVLAVGRLAYYKGHDILIRAASKLKNTKLVIAGDGKRRAYLTNLVEGLGLKDKVTLTGFIPNGKLYALMKTCDCLCLPSVERTEAFGVVLLEAMYYKKPVVASDMPGSGIGDIVEHYKTGILCSPGDVAELRFAMESLLSDPGLAKSLGEAGREKFDENFHIINIAKKLQNFIASCCTE